MMPATFTIEIPRLTLTAVIDILLVAFGIYRLLQIVRGTRAAHILTGILTVVAVYQIALRAGLETLRSMLASLAPYTAIAIIILFQSEIRRTLGRLGRKRLLGGFQRPASADEVVLALASMSRDKIGALIVMERDMGLRTFVESGVRLDSAVSRDLLLTIFQPGTTLHDGAVIIQKERIAAAACFLPLSVRPDVSTKIGTRHRAAIGITEETDCMALIVSEETGAISIAVAGEMETNVTIERVDERIYQHFGVKRTLVPVPQPSPRSAPRLTPRSTTPTADSASVSSLPASSLPASSSSSAAAREPGASKTLSAP